MSADEYAAAAGAYDLFAALYRLRQAAALDELLPRLRPKMGPILDIGAGSGANTAAVLDRIPDARVVALEPSRAMRSLILSRLAARPEWHSGSPSGRRTSSPRRCPNASAGRS